MRIIQTIAGIQSRDPVSWFEAVFLPIEGTRNQIWVQENLIPALQEYVDMVDANKEASYQRSLQDEVSAAVSNSQFTFQILADSSSGYGAKGAIRFQF